MSAEIDERYFGIQRVRGKWGREALLRKPLFVMLKRETCVYTQVVKNCSANELLPTLKDFVDFENVAIYSDSWKVYDGLIDFLLRTVCS